MHARRIRPEEYRRCQQLCALAFEYEMKDAGLTPEALLDKARGNPRYMQDVHWDSQYAAFDGDDRTMLATMTVAVPLVHAKPGLTEGWGIASDGSS